MILDKSECLWFGPVWDAPSWYWVGADVAERLKLWINVKYFTDVSELPADAVVFWIKRPGDKKTAEVIRRKRLMVIFFPVDCFDGAEIIAKHQVFVDEARLVCLHARSLSPFFANSKIAFVQHYNKYGVNFEDRIPGDYFLWVGGYQYVPYITEAIDYLRSRGNVLILTDNHNAAARGAAKTNAKRNGVVDFERYLSKSGITVQTWSEVGQREALLTCSAAFDIKCDDLFNQRHKPPTKMQKYLCSGIPCAINRDASLRKQLNMEVPEIRDLCDVAKRPSYLNKLWKHSEGLSAELSLGNVAQQYYFLAESVFSGVIDLACWPYAFRQAETVVCGEEFSIANSLWAPSLSFSS